MANRLEVYKCENCGHIVEVLHSAEGELGCCGKSMKLMLENTVDASLEKHVPVIEIVEDGIKVKVGSSPHPMIEEHYIEFVELIHDDRLCRIWLKPGMAPEATFHVKVGDATAREYCSVHGLWKS